jgi:MFS family permease
MTTAPRLRRWLALALLGTAFFMVILDGTIVYVALPQIAGDLGFSTGGVQWVMSAYLLCFGGLLPLGGRCADLLGRRRVFMVGVGLFACSSLMCGLAWFPAALIGARVLPRCLCGEFGAGLGSAFVASQIAALTGAAERESGLAAGLADSSFNIGSALGIAILSTVAVARTGPGAGLHAMTEGFQAAFAVAVGIATLGALVALLCFGRGRRSPATLPDPRQRATRSRWMGGGGNNAGPRRE